MTTRIHRIWQPGNPQTRVLLPNFWMKLVKPNDSEKMPPNMAKFVVSPQMTRYDIAEYLRKIYKIPVREVRTYMKQGKIEKDRVFKLIAESKEKDEKIAYVVMRKDQKFEFPDLFPIDWAKAQTKQIQKAKKYLNMEREKEVKSPYRYGEGTWFGL